MAVVAAIKAKTQSKTAMGKVMAYVIQDKKTRYFDPETEQKYRLISGQNCVAETAFKEFMATKIQYGKDNGVFYKQFVQSFKPGEAANPKEIHQMGLELAEYFEGFEVLVATHIDEDHWHNHLIINSVNVDTGLKIQFNERNFNQLRRRSDEICQAHGLETLKPYDKNSQVAGMNTREYRAALKGDSWKIKLINAVDMSMEASGTKGDFITNMERMGYGVKWIDHYKYITYTTPEGQKCRDNRLHDEKYLKERMEQHYGIRYEQSQILKQAGQTVGTAGKSVARIQSENSVLRNPAGSVADVGVYDDGNRKAPSADAGKNRRVADMERLGGADTADNRKSNEQSHKRGQSIRQQLKTGLQQADGNSYSGSSEIDGQQNFQTGTNAPSAGQYNTQAPVAVDRDWSGVANSVIGADTASKTAVVLEAVGLIENLLAVNDPSKETETKRQVVERKNRQKKKQEKSHEWDMSL